MTRKKLLTRFMLLVITLLIIGSIVQLSLYSPEALKETRGLRYYSRFNRHISFIGIAMLFILFKIPNDNKMTRALSFFMYFGNLILLILVLFIGSTKNGANRWIDLKVFQFQPSEFAKLSLVVMIALVFSVANNLLIKRKYLREKISNNIPVNMNSFEEFAVFSSTKKFKMRVILIVTMFSLIYFVLIYMSKSLSLTVQVLLIYLSMLWFSGYINPKYVIGLVIFFGMAIFIGIVSTPYRLARLSNPDQELYAIELIKSGGLFGTGYGNGIGRNFFLPEIQNDYIFAGIAEEWGLIVTLLLIVIFVVFIITLFQITYLAPTVFDKMLGIGISTMVTHQFLLHIGINVGLLPSTGVTLPFISYGGTSIGTIMLAMMFMKDIIFRIKDEKFEGDQYE